MKASELVKELQVKIQEAGDLEIVCDDEGYQLYTINEVSVVQDASSGKEKNFILLC